MRLVQGYKGMLSRQGKDFGLILQQINCSGY